MKTSLLLSLLAPCFSLTASATILRVNNTAGAGAPYTTVSAAIAAAGNGDTLMIECSFTTYGTITLTKRLTLTGPGFFLNDATPNPNTQANALSAMVDNVNLFSGSRGSVVEGLEISNLVNLCDSFITLQRNYLTAGTTLSLASCGGAISCDTIRNNYLNRIVCSSSAKVKDLLVYNNIFTGNAPVSFSNTISLGLSNGYCFNNTFVNSAGATFVCAQFIFQNNIIVQPSFGAYLNSNAYFNNVVTNAGLPSGNGNVLSASAAAIFLGWQSGAGFSSDGRYKLASGSAAAGAGTLNGTTVDCGAFGGPAPYVLSGMPPAPSIYSLSMPSQTAVGATSLPITVSAAAH